MATTYLQHNEQSLFSSWESLEGGSNLKSVGKHSAINQTYPSPIWKSMFKGMEWFPYEEWLSKMGIIQLGKEMTKGTYCRGRQNSHKNLMALRDGQQIWRVWQCVGDTPPQICLVSFC